MESDLGVMDYQACPEASTNITSNRPPKTTGNGWRKSVMKVGSMQQYTGPEQLKETFMSKKN